MPSVTPEQAIELARTLKKVKKLSNENRFLFYKPYPKQKEFHQIGKDYPERCLGAGNQLGKSMAGSMECAYHLTGIYPDWWEGLRFDQPIVMWVGGVTGLTIRDSTQKLLLGRIQNPEGEGTGSIPKHLLLEIVRAMGTKDLCDHAKIKHISGGTSLVFFKSYEQGREKWQAETVDFIWCDEEPPSDIYAEALTRTNNGQQGQRIMLTFTPLKGITEVVRKFYESPSKFQKLIMMTIYDVDHYSEEEREQIIQSYLPHEREARAKGIPVLGSGRIFPLSDDEVSCKPFEIPSYWARIKGIDFGYDHPSALACCAWDRDNDIFYVYDVWRKSFANTTEDPLAVTVDAINSRHSWIPVSWPHDGLQHDKLAGLQIAEQFKAKDVNMLPERATFEDGTNNVEPGIMDMLNRMKTGRFKVFNHLTEWFEEFRLYHRKDGKIVKVGDDLLSATRYALMMKRYAEVDTEDFYTPPRREVGVMGY